jgi:hypothetical protein
MEYMARYYAGQALQALISHRGIRENARADELSKLAAEAHAIGKAMVKEFLPAQVARQSG